MQFIEKITNWAWSWPILIVLLGGGILLSIRTGFVQIRHFGFAMKETFGKIFHSNVGGEGTVSPFQAATAALEARQNCRKQISGGRFESP